MKCHDYYCLLLGMTSCDLDAKSSVCRPQAAVAPQCQSVIAGPALARLVQPPSPDRNFCYSTQRHRSCIAKRHRCRCGGGVAAGLRLRPHPCSLSSCRARRSGTRAAGGTRGRRCFANLIKVYTWCAHCVQESDKVSSKFTCQYTNDGKSLHCCQKKFTSEVEKQQKQVDFDAKQIYIHAKKITFLVKTLTTFIKNMPKSSYEVN
jgi:hypothetical protein